MTADPVLPSGAARRGTFRRWQRVLRKPEFDRALAAGRRAGNDQFTVWVHPNGLAHARLGLMVGRRLGNAVHRNRLKRVLRAAFRLEQHALPPGYDVLIAPRLTTRLDVADARHALRRLVTRLVRTARGE